MKFLDWVKSYNYWVIVGILIFSVVLGVLNNLRFGSEDERRVPWWGSPVVAVDSED